MMANDNIWSMRVEMTGAMDRGEVRRMLGLLIDPGSCHEVRALPSGQSARVCGDDLDGAVRAVEDIIGSKGTYVTLNPVRSDLKGAARVSDIVCRRHFLIDCDPVRSDPDTNASEAEKDEAHSVLMAVLSDLDARGWPRPIVVDSGNGWHLIYSIDLPCDKLSQQLLAKCLKAVQARHGTPGAQIDTKVHNASRITKLAGTWVRKGPNTTERPHRMARLVSVPTAITDVTIEQLRDLAGFGTGPDSPGSGDDGQNDKPFDWTMTVPGPGTGGLEAYVRKAVDSECEKVESAPPGERNNTLNSAAFSLGQLLHLGVIDRQSLEVTLSVSARRAGLGEHETSGTIRSGLDAGTKEPRRVEQRAAGPTAKAAPIPEGVRLTVRASEIVPRKVDWLWPGRIPIGFITVFAGRTGLGKSFVTSDFASRISQGEDLPDGPSGIKGACRDVMIISEDPYDTMLTPRFIELGADLNRIHFFRWEVMASFTLDNTEVLERAFAESDEPILLCIDPPTNFLGDHDEHKNSEVRTVLMHLVQWVAEKQIACVLITHVNKSQGKGVDALSRIIGSVAWTTTARVVHLFASDPDDAAKCLFCPDKNNLGKKAKTLSYSIESTDTLANIKWHGEVDLTSDQAMSGEKAKPRRVVASQWLIERFRERLEWASDELFKAASQENLSRDAVFEGKKTLCLPRARKETLPNGDIHWVWWVPPDWPYLTADK